MSASDRRRLSGGGVAKLQWRRWRRGACTTKILPVHKNPSKTWKLSSSTAEPPGAHLAAFASRLTSPLCLEIFAHMHIKAADDSRRCMLLCTFPCQLCGSVLIHDPGPNGKKNKEMYVFSGIVRKTNGRTDVSGFFFFFFLSTRNLSYSACVFVRLCTRVLTQISYPVSFL